MTFSRGANPLPPARLAKARAVQADHEAARDARAVRTVAGHASGVEDCCELLAMLGLDAVRAEPVQGRGRPAR